jgi:replicative DNA helicase
MNVFQLQKELLAAVLTSKEFLMEVSPQIFQDPLIKKLVVNAQRYLKQYEEIPTLSHLVYIADSQFDSSEKTRTGEILETLPFPSKFAKEVIKQKITQASFWETVSQTTNFLADVDMEKSPEKVVKKINELQKWTEDILAYGEEEESFIDFMESTETRVSERLIEEDETIPTLMYGIDKAFCGGPETGTLNCVLGASGQGKSVFLVNVAWGAVVAGYDVYFLTLEISAKKTLDRLDMRACGMDKFTLKTNPLQVKQKLKMYKDTLNIGNIYVQYLSNANIYTIQNQLKKLKQQKGKTPKVLIVDYADLLNHGHGNLELRHQLEKTFQKLRNIAVENNLVVWTASQLNRNGSKKGKQNLYATKEDIAEGWGKVAVCDTVSVLTETGIFLDKVRDDVSHIHVPLFVHLPTMQMRSTYNTNTNTESKESKDLFPEKKESPIVLRHKSLLNKFEKSSF